MAEQKNCTDKSYLCKTRCISKKRSCGEIKINREYSNVLNILSDAISSTKMNKVGTIAVTTAGIVGEKIGGRIAEEAGLPEEVGAMAGELIGSTSVKHAGIMVNAYKDLANTKEFESLNKWQKGKEILRKSREAESKVSASTEATLFIVGNIVGESLNFIPLSATAKGFSKAAIAIALLEENLEKYYESKFEEK